MGIALSRKGGMTTNQKEVSVKLSELCHQHAQAVLSVVDELLKEMAPIWGIQGNDSGFKRVHNHC